MDELKSICRSNTQTMGNTSRKLKTNKKRLKKWVLTIEACSTLSNKKNNNKIVKNTPKKG